jgi:hypothetical protein
MMSGRRWRTSVKLGVGEWRLWRASIQGEERGGTRDLGSASPPGV